MAQLRHGEPSLGKNIKVFKDLTALSVKARPHQFQQPRPQVPHGVRQAPLPERLRKQSWQTHEASKFRPTRRANQTLRMNSDMPSSSALQSGAQTHAASSAGASPANSDGGCGAKPSDLTATLLQASAYRAGPSIREEELVDSGETTA